MSMKTDKILEKLRKLMNLKESAQACGNEGEANAAAAGITRLLMEYNLSENDIPEQEKIDNPIISEEIPYRTPVENGPWYSLLVGIICDYNLCRTLFVSKRQNGRLKREKIEIIGRKKNVEVVLYLVSFLANQFVVHGRKKYPEYKHESIWKLGQTPQSERMYMKSFLYGCSLGLKNKFRADQLEFSKTVDITSLTVSNEAEIDNFLKGQKIGTARASKSSVDYASARLGYSVGENVEIHKGVYAQTVDEERRLR